MLRVESPVALGTKVPEDQDSFKQIFASSPDPTWIIDGHRFIECNEAAIRTLGYPGRDELLNVHPSQLSPPNQPDGEDSYVKAERMMAITKDKGLHRFEWMHTKADGTDFVAEVTLSTIQLADRHVIYCVWRDITERKQAETALRESEARYSTLIKNVGEGIGFVDSGEQFTFANPAAERIFGVASGGLLGRTLREFTTPAQFSAIEEQSRRRETGEKSEYEVEIRRLDGEERSLLVTAVPQFDDQGRFKGAFGVFRDITERKQHEAQQLLVSQRMRALLNLPAAAEGRDETEFLQYGLEQVEALTGSQVSFVHFVDDDQESIELVTWSQATLKNYCSATFNRHYPVSQAGIWADALRQRKPVLVNAYANAAGRHGLPEGHAHLDRLISVPVIEGGLVRMILGAGNKPEPYSELDTETARLLAESLWRIASQRRAEAALRKSEERYRLMFDNAGDGIMILSLSGKLVATNEAFARMHGYTTEEMSCLSLKDLDTPEAARLIPDRMQRILAGEFVTFEVEHYHKDGHVFPLEVSASLINDQGVSLIQTFHRDITERRSAERKLMQYQSLMSAVMENFPGAVSVMDSDLRLTWHNSQFKELLEFPDSLFEKPEVSLADFIRYNAQRGEYGPGDIEQQVAASIERARKFQPHRFERERSNARVLEVRGEPLSTGGFVTVYLDITERKQLENQVRELAFHDALTKLPNRRLLVDRLNQTMSASKRSGNYGALLALDLDNFKPINDTHGHLAGDLLLVEVARRLIESVRETDTVARVGGDEFVVILVELDADKAESARQAAEVAEKIRTSLAAPYQLILNEEGQAGSVVQHRCSASIGVALFLNHEASQADILKWADSAMYQAKDAGRNAIRLYGLTS